MGNSGQASAARRRALRPLQLKLDARLQMNGGVLVAVFILGLSARLLWNIAFRNIPFVADAADYATEASALVTGGLPHTPWYWPPGMVFLLGAVFAVIGPGVLAARLLTILLGLGSIVLAIHLATRMSQQPSAAAATGMIAALYGPAVMLSGQPFSQHLAALSLLGLCVCVLQVLETGSWKWAGLAGLAFGVGCLARPSMLALAPIALSFVLPCGPSSERRWRQVANAVVFICAAAATLLPVLRFNEARGGGWVLSTNNERNFFLGNNPYTPDYKTSHLASRSLEELDAETRRYLKNVYDRTNTRDVMRTEAWRFIREHPWRTLKRTIYRTLAFWGFDHQASREHARHAGWGTTGLAALLAYEAGSYLAVAVLVLFGLLCCRDTIRKPVLKVTLALVIMYQIPYSVAFSAGTYHFPVIYLLMPVAGAAVAWISAVGPRVAAARAWAKPSLAVALIVFALVQAQYAYHLLERAAS